MDVKLDNPESKRQSMVWKQKRQVVESAKQQFFGIPSPGVLLINNYWAQGPLSQLFANTVR